MWEDDWALLGIEPTTQIAAIKKAYALKLKVTRPDDDAAAYQALRSAYERAQQWAAWERARQGEATAAASTPDEPEPAPHPVAATSPPADAPQPAAPEPEPVAAPAQQHQPEPEPPAPRLTPLAASLPPPAAEAVEPVEVVNARDLIHALELAWRRDGEAALLHLWTDVRATLDAQPLSRQAEFSSAFAHWLVNLPQLPDRFAARLNDHFGWLGDFRTERLIGPALAQAVQTALADRLPQPVDPGLRATADPLLRLAALRAGHWWRLHLLVLMLHPAMAQLFNGLGPALLRRVGLDLHNQTWLRERLQRGLWLRVGLFTALVAGSVWLLTRNVGAVLVQTGHWAFSVCAAMLVGVFLGAFINNGPRLTVGGRRRALPLAVWRQHRLQPLLGLMWLLFAAWLLYMGGGDGDDPRAGPLLMQIPGWVWTLASGGFALAGLFVAWPLVPMHGLVLGSLAPFVAYLFVAALGAWLPPAGAVCIGMAWLLAGAAVFSQRLDTAVPVQWLCRPVMNTLVLADRWSYSLAMLPLGAALAWMAVTDGPARPLTLFAIWALGNVAAGWLQARLDTVGLRWLPAAADREPTA